MCRFHVVTAMLGISLILISQGATAGLFSPENLQECLIDQLSGANNDTVAQQLAARCLQRFGEGGRVVKQTGMFARYHSGRDCTLAEAKDTPSEFAAQVIEANCYLVYETGSEN